MVGAPSSAESSWTCTRLRRRSRKTLSGGHGCQVPTHPRTPTRTTRLRSWDPAAETRGDPKLGRRSRRGARGRRPGATAPLGLRPRPRGCPCAKTRLGGRPPTRLPARGPHPGGPKAIRRPPRASSPWVDPARTLPPRPGRRRRPLAGEVAESRLKHLTIGPRARPSPATSATVRIRRTSARTSRRRGKRTRTRGRTKARPRSSPTRARTPR
mmetsp:Transcript_52513/g.114919  ORF Transcript_52513/g.114919 Transcript_52513/m.114919 type:complete len:212 (-) Transcript_52513:860-1495(-)